MQDVLGTIQADQDAIIRAGSRGTLVVDGGPGTGKTVVALHRTAYLLYADPRLSHRRGGVLFVGPHLRAVLPDANVRTSLRSTGVPVVQGPVSDLDAILDSWLATSDGGIACVITTDGTEARTVRTNARVRWLHPNS